MATILLDPPTTDTVPATIPDQDHEARDGMCPACGSSSTYQTMEGKWGCCTCGATWS